MALGHENFFVNDHQPQFGDKNSRSFLDFENFFLQFFRFQSKSISFGLIFKHTIQKIKKHCDKNKKKDIFLSD